MNVIKTPTGLVPVDEIARVMTQAQYDALSAEEKKDGTFYITDDNGTSVMDIIGNRDISSIGKTVKDAIYIIDNKLETNSKVVSSAINEVNSKITNVIADLKSGWNTVKLEKLFPVSWVFVSKPYCYTSDGETVDFHIRNWNDNLNNRMYWCLETGRPLSKTGLIIQYSSKQSP